MGINKRPFLLQLNLNGSSAGTSVPTTSFYGKGLKKVHTSKSTCQRTSFGRFKVFAEVDEKKQTDKDRWKGLVFDESDDQQDITRGKGMVDSLFQAPMGSGTHYAVMSSYDYISAGLRQYVIEQEYVCFDRQIFFWTQLCGIFRQNWVFGNWFWSLDVWWQHFCRYNLDNNMDGFYIAPAFMDKLVVHITKNFLTLPNIKVFFLWFFSHETSLILCLEWNSIEFTLSWNFVDRFLLSWAFGEAKVRGNHSSVSLCLPKWESSESILSRPPLVVVALLLAHLPDSSEQTPLPRVDPTMCGPYCGGLPWSW